MHKQKTIDEIEKIHNDYLDKMRELKREQDRLIKEFIFKLEEKKKEELRKKLD